MDNAALLDRISTDRLQDLGQQLRVDSVRASAAASSGHPTSSMSAADLMAVLLARHFRYDFTDPHAAGNDHLIFSKGHASPLLDAMYRAAGAIDDAELLSYRSRGSRLEGHPTPRMPWVDVATGSLGLGLPVSVGLALTGATSTGCRTGSGCCAGTASWPRGPSGRRSSMRPATSWTT
jgi:transketolase